MKMQLHVYRGFKQIHPPEEPDPVDVVAVLKMVNDDDPSKPPETTIISYVVRDRSFES